jgi:anti-sigma factor (TIGR02949 family)
MNKTHECSQLLSSLSDYVDGALSAELCTELERHMENCENCSIVVNTLRKTVELYHRPAPQEQLPEDVRERLYYRLKLDDYLE